MITINNVFQYVISPNNAERAYHQAASCKRYRREFLEFDRNRYYNIEYLRQSLINKSYIMGDYKYFTVYEPKPRNIMKLPVEDRVVQHMWNNTVNTIIDPRLFEHSYACRPNKGMHLASHNLANWIYGLYYIEDKKKLWAIKGDIKSFFKTISHEVLKNQFRRFISDKEILWLTDLFIDHNGTLPNGMGIPVGNLSSQLFANIYGDILDRFVKQSLQCRYYMRYMDDFIILDDDYRYLEYVLEQISIFIQSEMRMTLNPKTTIVYVPDGLDFIGFIHYPDHVIPRKEKRRDLIRYVNRYIDGYIETEEFKRSFVSRLGHIEHCNTYNFINGIIEDLIDYWDDIESPEYYEICKEEEVV